VIAKELSKETTMAEEIKKAIKEEILKLPEGIVKTDVGDLLVKTVGSKFVHVYNLHKRKYEKYTLKGFAPFVLGKNWKEE
jgi:chaperonin cofactor prefoldin